MTAARRAAAFVLLAVSTAMPAAAQTGAASGALVVTVVDTTALPVPGSAVSVTSEATGLTRTDATGPGGRVSLPALAVGGYAVRALLPDSARVPGSEL